MDDGPLAILFGDLRDFTAYTARCGDEEAFQLVQTFLELVRREAKGHNGRLVKSYGDGVMIAFPTVSDAVRCAIGMQRALSEQNRANPEQCLCAGIGIAWGMPIRENDDLFGHTVNVAKRLADLAKGGQIVLSAKAKETVGDLEAVRYVDLGYQPLKGLGQQRVYGLIWRDELARLPVKEGKLDLILTRDKLIIELSKRVQEEIQRARTEIHREAEQSRGLAKWILSKIERSLPTFMRHRAPVGRPRPGARPGERRGAPGSRRLDPQR